MADHVIEGRAYSSNLVTRRNLRPTRQVTRGGNVAHGFFEGVEGANNGRHDFVGEYAAANHGGKYEQG